MKKFFLVSVSTLLILLALFGVWFGVSYSKNGLAKQLYDKMFNVEEPTEEPQEPEEPEAPENYAYKIVVTKPEDVNVPTTGTLRKVQNGDKLGGKWYAVDMERSGLCITADNLVFLNGYSDSTRAFINNYFGIEIFPINNGYLFYLPEEFSGTYYVGYDEELNIELNRDYTISWNKDTTIESVDCELYYVEESEQEIIFPYDINAYQFDVTIPEDVEVPVTGTLRKVEVGETLGGKWYAVDCNQYNVEKLKASYLQAGSMHFRKYVGELDTFVALNTYSCIESTIVNGINVFYLPEEINVNRYVGYDSANQKLVDEPRVFSWNSETIIESACSFVYVIEESVDELKFPYATDEDYCAYKLDVTIPEGVEAPTTGTLRKAEVGETLGGKWYAVDIVRRKAEKFTNSFISSHDMHFNSYNRCCSELDTLVTMNTYSGIECVTVGNVTMFYLPESIKVVRNVGYDRHTSTMFNATREFQWNATTDITAVGDYVYVVETGDGELSFPVIETEETVDYSQINNILVEPDNVNLTSGEVAELNVYAYLDNGEKILLADKLEYREFFLPESGYTTLEVYNTSTDEIINDQSIIDEIFSKMCTFDVVVENGKIIIQANYVKEYSDEIYRAILPENFLVVFTFGVNSNIDSYYEVNYIEVYLN